MAVEVRALSFVALLAGSLRLAFVLWAPGQLTGDSIFYHLYALAIRDGRGFVSADGSPGIMWPPGWPGFLAGAYTLFGDGARVGMIANALFGAATAATLTECGARLFDRRIGLFAGILYAVWPGNIYYSATLFTEPLFTALISAWLLLLIMAASRSRRARNAWSAAAGGLLVVAALAKAEPLALAPVLVAFLWVIRQSTREFLRRAALAGLVTAAVLLPWTVRNYRTFGRLIPISASGGLDVYLGNHAGSTGTPDGLAALLATTEYFNRHKRATFAETLIAESAAGWHDVWDFVRSNPREEIRLLIRKLYITYAGDGWGASLVAGIDHGTVELMPRSWCDRLVTVADAFWFGLLALAAVGLLTLRSWSIEARVLVLGLLGVWTGLQLLVYGGPRFHVPEAPSHVLLAARGLDVVARRWRS